MLIEEIVRTELDEGIKDWIAQAALATSLLFAPDAQAKTPVKPSAQTTAPAAAKAKSSTQAKPLVTQLLSMRADTPEAKERLLKTMAINAGIKGNELVALLSQSAHETLGFKALREIGNPNYFARYDKKSKAKILGNVQPGDGFKYRGGGFLHITGRYNYAKIGKALGIDLENRPELIERPGVAAAASLAYWKNRVRPNVKDFKNVEQVTKKINPAKKHMDRREAEYARIRSQMSKKIK
jgi:putative chitinase